MDAHQRVLGEESTIIPPILARRVWKTDPGIIAAMYSGQPIEENPKRL
ncbi:hypothetical protein AA0522_1132 [Gluconacetobacter liquefaciens NRIC 0522]|nr:hypothetical protein AA0522_1132 [Gluconacetobacter liquefaciens NRIC 0522]